MVIRSLWPLRVAWGRSGTYLVTMRESQAASRWSDLGVADPSPCTGSRSKVPSAVSTSGRDRCGWSWVTLMDARILGGAIMIVAFKIIGSSRWKDCISGRRGVALLNRQLYWASMLVADKIVGSSRWGDLRWWLWWRRVLTRDTSIRRSNSRWWLRWRWVFTSDASNRQLWPCWPATSQIFGPTEPRGTPSKKTIWPETQLHPVHKPRHQLALWDSSKGIGSSQISGTRVQCPSAKLPRIHLGFRVWQLDMGSHWHQIDGLNYMCHSNRVLTACSTFAL